MIKKQSLVLFVLVIFLAGCAGLGAQESKSPAAVAKSYFDLGAAYMLKKRYDLAEPKLQLSMQAKSSPETLNALAVLYEQQHDNQLAEESYKKLLKSFPDYAPGYSNYYIFLCKYDRQNQIMALNALMSTKGADFAELGLVAAGDCSLSKNRKAEAKRYYQKALVYNPHLAGALLPLAQIDYDQGFVREAKKKVDLVNNQVGYSARSVYLSALINRDLGNRMAVRKFMQILSTQFAGSPEASALLK